MIAEKVRNLLKLWSGRAVSALLCVLVAGSTLGFGGQVWWFCVFVAACVGLLSVCGLVGVVASGCARVVKGPVWALAGLILAIAALQVAPLPARFAGLSVGAPGAVGRLQAELSGSVREDPSDLPEATGPIVISADRPATLRWLFGGLACAAVAFAACHNTDRSARFERLTASLVASFGVCTAVAVLQLAGEAPGEMGLWIPGRGPSWAPGLSDLADGPSLSRLRLLPAATATLEASTWPVAQPAVPFAFGPLVAGAGAYLALASLVLPLCVGMAVQRAAPRGSVEPLSRRLRDRGGVASLALLLAVAAAGSFLCGWVGGMLLGAALALGIVVAGLAGAHGAGGGRFPIFTTLGVIAALGLGCVTGEIFGRPEGAPWVASSAKWPELRALWSNALAAGRGYPALGIGFGAFASVEPYLKRQDVLSTTAQSSVFQLWAEAGAAGLTLAALALAWVAARLPKSWLRLSPADRPAAAALVGAWVSFLAVSLVHWTIQLPAAALAATAVAGISMRWLAGGTDLFVDDPGVPRPRGQGGEHADEARPAFAHAV